jgi:antitoxin ParD1/3/4
MGMRTTLNISLPESMRTWVDEQIEIGGYGTASEFFRQLVREAQQRKVREEVDRKLLEALDSKASPVTPESWERLRRDARKRLAAKRKPAP